MDRLRLGETLLSLDGDLLVIAVAAWEPGIFFKHVEAVRVELEPHGADWVARFRTVGGPVDWQPVAVPVPAAERPALEVFLAELERRATASRAG